MFWWSNALKNRENYPRWTKQKETRIDFNPGFVKFSLLTTGPWCDPNINHVSSLKKFFLPCLHYKGRGCPLSTENKCKCVLTCQRDLSAFTVFFCTFFFKQCQSADDQSRLYQSCMLAIQRITHSSPAAQVVVKICLVVNDIRGLLLIAELSIQWTKEEKTFITSITQVTCIPWKVQFLFVFVHLLCFLTC